MDKELVVLTGVSGAGKSTAMGFLEDVGYYCIDNMPPELIATFVGLLAKDNCYDKVALVADVRSNKMFEKLLENIDKIENYKYSVRIIYLDVEVDELKRRLSNIKTRGIAAKRGETVEEIYSERAGLYSRYADCTLSISGGTAEDAVLEICKIL